MKKLLFLAVLILLLPGCQSIPDSIWDVNWQTNGDNVLNFAPSEEVDYKNQSMEEHSKLYDLTVDYPEFILSNITMQDKLNQEIKTKVDTIINSFMDGANEEIEDYPLDLISMLDINYGIDSLTSSMISLHFDVYLYFIGAAHGFDYFETFNYDLIKDKKLSLLDIFRADTKYLNKFSEIGNQYFSQKFPEEDYWHPEGVEPREENFRNFTLNNSSIIFYFDDYAIAPYVEGTQELEIPLMDLNDYLLPEYQKKGSVLQLEVKS